MRPFAVAIAAACQYFARNSGSPGGVVAQRYGVGLATKRSRVRSTARARLCNDSGQVVHTHLPTVFVSIMPSAITCRVCVLQAREYSRKAVSASACLSADSDRFSRQLVDFLKLCENVNSTAPPTE